MLINKFTISPLETPKNNVVAIASATFYGLYTVNNITICKGNNDNLFVKMPQKRTQQGNFIDVTHPIKSDARNEINELLINSYKSKNYHQEGEFKDPVNISVQNVFKYTSESPQNALSRMDVVVNDMVIHNCKLIQNQNSEKAKLILPSYKDKSEKYHSLVVPTNSKAYLLLNNAALSGYNTSYSYKKVDDSALNALKNSGIDFAVNKSEKGENLIKFKSADINKVNALLSPTPQIKK